MRNCNSCADEIRKNKDAIKERAIKFAVTTEQDIQIHSWTQRGVGRLWDFEPLGSVERGIGLIEIIKFRDHVSEDVLQDSGESSSVSEETKGDTKSSRGRKKRSSSKPE